jgi:hypothetical protein
MSITQRAAFPHPAFPRKPWTFLSKPLLTSAKNFSRMVGEDEEWLGHSQERKVSSH